MDARPAADASTDRFVTLLTQHRHAVYAFILKQVAQAADAEDIFQKTTLVLWKKMEQFDSGGSFFHWACGVAHNEVRNFLAGRRRSRLHFDADLVQLIADEAAEEHHVSEARRASLEHCLAKLSERQREILRRCHSDPGTITEVADRLGRSRGALYKQLARLKEKLLDCVRQRVAAEGGPA